MYILGIQILRNRRRRQSSLSIVLETFNMSDCKPIKKPTYVGRALNMDICPKVSDEMDWMNQIFYLTVDGSMIFINGLCSTKHMSRN